MATNVWRLGVISGLYCENLRPQNHLSNLNKFSKRKTVPLFRQTAVICSGFSAASLRKKTPSKRKVNMQESRVPWLITEKVLAKCGLKMNFSSIFHQTQPMLFQIV
jgi:hypothetical protein